MAHQKTISEQKFMRFAQSAQLAHSFARLYSFTLLLAGLNAQNRGSFLWFFSNSSFFFI